MTGCLATIRSFLRDDSGAAFVEFAFGAPLLLVVAFGAAEIGRAITYHHAVEKSMRAATRYLARLPLVDADTVPSWALDNARNLAVFGNIGGSGPPLLPDWRTDSIALSAPPYDESLRLTAQVTYDFPMLSILNLDTGMTFRVSHEERYVGN